MRITDFQISKCRQRMEIWKLRLYAVLALELDDTIVYFAAKRLKAEEENIARLKLRRQHVKVCIFNLNAYSDHQCLTDFRFTRNDIGMLCERFQWPGITSRNEYSVGPITAMCVFLHRLSTPTRWFDMERTFGLFASQLSEVFWEHVELCVELFDYTLQLRPQFMRDRAHQYAEVLEEHGSPLDSVIAFIDCTKIRIARPGGQNHNQQSVYSGHKRKHCLTYQSLSTPDGLMVALYGPVEGRRHDLTLFRQSGWEQVMSDSFNIEGRQYYVYGDSAYLIRPYMQRPFLNGFATAEQVAFNSEMSSLRVLVEHNYRDLKQMWTSQDFARQLKVRLAPIGLLYKSSAILLNVRTCLYQGGQTIARFALPPPSLDEFLRV